MGIRYEYVRCASCGGQYQLIDFRANPRKGKEYWVQGSVADVVTLLNATEAKEESVQ